MKTKGSGCQNSLVTIAQKRRGAEAALLPLCVCVCVSLRIGLAAGGVVVLMMGGVVDQVCVCL